MSDYAFQSNLFCSLGREPERIGPGAFQGPVVTRALASLLRASAEVAREGGDYVASFRLHREAGRVLVDFPLAALAPRVRPAPLVALANAVSNAGVTASAQDLCASTRRRNVGILVKYACTRRGFLNACAFDTVLHAFAAFVSSQPSLSELRPPESSQEKRVPQ